jgi:hypothetical protein
MSLTFCFTKFFNFFVILNNNFEFFVIFNFFLQFFKLQKIKPQGSGVNEPRSRKNSNFKLSTRRVRKCYWINFNITVEGNEMSMRERECTCVAIFFFNQNANSSVEKKLTSIGFLSSNHFQYYEATQKMMIIITLIWEGWLELKKYFF